MAEKLKTYKTQAGAQQYGSLKDWNRLSKRLFANFLKDPNLKNLAKNDQARAGAEAALAKELQTEFAKKNLLKYELEKKLMTRVRKNRALSLLRSRIKEEDK